MSTEISGVRAKRFKEAEYKRHNFEMKKMKAENAREYQKTVKKNEILLGNVSKEYDSKVNRLENELGKKLFDVRNKQSEQLKLENNRLAGEVQDLKRAHHDQVEELKEGQNNQLQDMKISHEKILEQAKQNFMKEKLKWES